jgi:hypothetical protein
MIEAKGHAVNMLERDRQHLSERFRRPESPLPMHY